MTDFELEYDDTCDKDYVVIRDASGYSSNRICGTAGLGYTYVSVGNLVTVEFHTDSSVTRQGFSMHYEAIIGK